MYLTVSGAWGAVAAHPVRLAEARAAARVGPAVAIVKAAAVGPEGVGGS